MAVAVMLLFWTGVVLGATPVQGQQTLDELVVQYLDGDADQAVRTLASWPQDRLRRESKTIGRGWDAATRALFHYEALHQPEALRHPGTSNLHRIIAEGHLQSLSRSLSEVGDTLRSMCRDLSLLLRTRGDAWGELEDRFRLDPLVVLAHGRFLEYWSPRIESKGGTEYGFMTGESVLRTSHGQFGPEIHKAESTFQRVLEVEPSLVEARVRLGRVLWMKDRRSDAQRELQRAVSEAMAGSSEWAYLANVFLGQIFEEGGRSTEAAGAYRAALRILPGGQVATIRLGHVLVDSGAPSEGWVSAAVAVHQVRELVDPWLLYFSEQLDGPDRRARARALRQRLRQEIPR